MVNTIQNDYVMQANEFSERNGIEIKITFKERNSNPMWEENYLRNCYSVYIRNTNSGAVMRVTFWDSIYNTTHNITPTCYDILACLTKYDPGDYEDFCSEFGYETETENEFGRLMRNPNAYKIWKERLECLSIEHIDKAVQAGIDGRSRNKKYRLLGCKLFEIHFDAIFFNFHKIKKKKSPDALSNLPIGSEIKFTLWDGTEKRLVKHPAAYQFSRPFWMNLNEYTYVPVNRIPKNYEVIRRGA